MSAYSASSAIVAIVGASMIIMAIVIVACQKCRKRRPIETDENLPTLNNEYVTVDLPIGKPSSKSEAVILVAEMEDDDINTLKFDAQQFTNSMDQIGMGLIVVKNNDTLQNKPTFISIYMARRSFDKAFLILSYSSNSDARLAERLLTEVYKRNANCLKSMVMFDCGKFGPSILYKHRNPHSGLGAVDFLLDAVADRIIDDDLTDALRSKYVRIVCSPVNTTIDVPLKDDDSSQDNKTNDVIV